MNYEYPLMEEERKAYIVSGDVDIDKLLNCGPWSIVEFSANSGVETMTMLRQWWEPIEDEI